MPQAKWADVALAYRRYALTKRSWYSVSVETGGPTIDVESPEGIAALERWAEALSDLQEVQGPSSGWGGQLAPGPGATLSVEASGPDVAARLAIEAVRKAARSTEISLGRVVRLDVMTEDYQDRWLDQPDEKLVGVSEIAAMLGVSKQRVSELRSSDDFPQPVAELAAGPVWRRSTLERFILEWPRRPGRPLSPLSLDQKEILRLMSEEPHLSPSQLAQALGMEPVHVRSHLRRIRRRMV